MNRYTFFLLALTSAWRASTLPIPISRNPYRLGAASSSNEDSRMKSGFSDTRVIARLLKNNDAPSDDERVVLRTKLRTLEDQFQAIVGKTFSNELEEKRIPRAAKGPLKGIQLRRTLLCGVRSIPDELLQTILEFVVLEEDDSHDAEALRSVCSVSRRWRQAAIGHCILWTTPDPINFIGTPKPQHIRKITNRLRIYLTRSGGLPISFSLWLYHSVWEDVRELVQEPVQLLIDQCHRWDKVQIQTPLTFYAQLAPIRGKLPMLRELDIDTDWRCDDDPGNKTLNIDCFADAPSLRKVTYDTRYAFRIQWGDPDPTLRFSFPWSQLQELRAHVQSDTSYFEILRSQPLQLKRLEYTSSSTALKTLDELAPMALPSLERLVLRICEADDASSTDVLAHLDLLTLPALTHLEIRGISSPRLYDRLLHLVVRSGCSLKCLCVNAGETFTTGLAAAPCSQLLALCPELTHLLITSPEGELIDSLIFDPTSPLPVLPKLKVLTISNTDVNGFTRALDASALMKLIKSRTDGLPEGTSQTLEEITFLWDDSEMLQLQIAFMEIAEAFSEEEATFSTVRTEAEELALRVRTTLDSKFSRWYHPRRTYFNLKLHLDMDNLLSRLESMDLGKHNTRPLMRRGVPYLLHSISTRSSGIIPGDRLFHFRARIKKLCEKWKPLFLRDASPYYWCFYGDSSASMRWTPSQGSEDDYVGADNSKDSRMWRDITGQSEYMKQVLSWY